MEQHSWPYKVLIIKLKKSFTWTDTTQLVSVVQRGLCKGDLVQVQKLQIWDRGKLHLHVNPSQTKWSPPDHYKFTKEYDIADQ